MLVKEAIGDRFLRVQHMHDIYVILDTDYSTTMGPFTNMV